MPKPLPRLRMDLDFVPSPLEDRPGLLIRDPFGYSDAVLVIPPPLVPVLEMFDGQRTVDDICRALVELTGDLQAGQIHTHLESTLHQAGFLEDELFDQLRDDQHRAFAESPDRLPANAGQAYPEEPNEIRAWLDHHALRLAPEPTPNLVGIAAPHASPDGAWPSYRAAYGALDASLGDKTFVVIGTSHYGEPESFGLTRKSFVTPLGRTRTRTDLVDRLLADAPAAIRLEDYCHAVEHSLEFQILFLQALYGPDIQILPILCGPFAHSVYRGGLPEDDPGVAAFLRALAALHADHAGNLVWVLGIDLAHMGARYGDPVPMEAERDLMLEVRRRDRARLEAVEAGDPAAFWALVQENQDDLKWCGSSSLYTMLRSVPGLRARTGHYEHWQIDPQSVVTVAGLEFYRP